MTTQPDRVKTLRAKTSVETRSGAAQAPLAGKSLPALRRALLGWYDEHRRDLPWRKTRDPYRIWLSEVMLQQTRVTAVLDHYRIFLERFPDIAALAAASEDAVLAAWSGLGYYRRARMLHRCAGRIVQTHAGEFPRSAKELQALPGIGRYTAAAIASIAFNEPVAVVDGNVERVLQRLTAAALSAGQNWQQAQSLLTPSRAGDSNQALMELGATVCVPREPHCAACPVRKWCATRGEHPRAQRSPRLKKAQVWCSVDRSSDSNRGAKTGKIRLVQRPKHLSLMAGMWELPQSSEPPLPLPDSARWRTFRHSITVTEYTVHVLRNTRLVGGSSSAKGTWIAIDRIPLLPLTGLTRKILKADGII
jgi:A/G-specific adenine glycosylase